MNHGIGRGILYCCYLPYIPPPPISHETSIHPLTLRGDEAHEASHLGCCLFILTLFTFFVSVVTICERDKHVKIETGLMVFLGHRKVKCKAFEDSSKVMSKVLCPTLDRSFRILQKMNASINVNILFNEVSLTDVIFCELCPFLFWHW